MGFHLPEMGNSIWLALDPSTGSHGMNLAQANPEYQVYEAN